MIAKGSQDIHYDMAEQVALSQELAFGYAKHPPLAAAVARAWFTLFPLTDWAYYLLAVATAALALWIAWRVSARFLDGEKRVLGLALLTLVPFFNFHALKFNQNTLLMPLWAATTLFFLRSFETRRVMDAALAGVTAAAAMYGKYWSIFLIAGLGVAALADPRRAVYFRSPAPWVTIAVGALALAPHVAWLVANGFEPFSYAVLVHGGTSVMSALGAAFGYLAGSVGYVAVAVVFAVLATRPSRGCGAGQPVAGDARAPARGGGVLGDVAVAGSGCDPRRGPPHVAMEHAGLDIVAGDAACRRRSLPSTAKLRARILMVAVLFPLVILAVAPAIAVVAHRAGVTPAAAHSSLLAAPVERLWRETSDQPLRLFSSYEDFNYGVAFYLPSRPLTVNALDGVPPPELDARIARDGIVLVCPAQAQGASLSQTPSPRGAGGEAHRGGRHAPLLGRRGTIGALSDHRHSAAALSGAIPEPERQQKSDQ